MANNSYTCPRCHTINTSVLESPGVLVCKGCSAVIMNRTAGELIPARVPIDWSFMRIGVTGIYQNQPFAVIGRIRLQLRNDYKNFWCCAVKGGQYFWIAESFASFAVLNAQWEIFKEDVTRLHAAESIKLNKDVKLKGEYVEKCEGVSYEGEVGNWKLFKPGFFFIQASNNNQQTAMFVVDARKNIEYLTGEKMAWEKLNLNNIVTWDEWK